MSLFPTKQKLEVIQQIVIQERKQEVMPSEYDPGEVKKARKRGKEGRKEGSIRSLSLFHLSNKILIKQDQISFSRGVHSFDSVDNSWQL